MMKIYTKIILDIDTGEIVRSESYDYQGPVAWCGGGQSGGGGTSYDPAYNKGMLELSKEQQDWAREMFNQYQYGVPYNPGEVDPTTGKTLGDLKGYDPNAQTSEMQFQQNVVNANQSLLPEQTQLERSTLQAQGEVLPLQTDVTKATLSDTLKNISERAPVRTEMYNEALNGIDVNSRMNEAQAGVEHAFSNAGDQIRRSAMYSGGLDPTSIASLNTGMNLEKAKTIAGARTLAKNTAETEQFNRLRSAMSVA